MSHPIVAVILAAGKGTRMDSPLPKPMMLIGDMPMVGHVLEATTTLNPVETYVVIGPDMAVTKQYVSPVTCVIQEQRLGTGHAVQISLNSINSSEGTLMILNGDVPLIETATLEELVNNQVSQGHAVSILGFDARAPGAYGRMIVEDGALVGIVEANEATPDQLKISLCNGGVYAVDLTQARRLVERISRNTNSGEFYLTDIVTIALEAGLTCGFTLADETELAGANDRTELAYLDHLFSERKSTNQSSLYSVSSRPVEPARP